MTNAPALPRLLALCGRPGSGKSTAARLLVEEYGYTLADDGLPLRQIAMNQFGLTEHQVFTQAGKLEEIEIVGVKMTARKFLGDLGLALENQFGEDIIPLMTHRSLDSAKRYVMGSVRRNQGRYWRSHGAVTLEVVNPGVEPSPYLFDWFNPDFVDVQVRNPFNESQDPIVAQHRLLEALAETLSVAEKVAA